MIRERRLATVSYVSGARVPTEISKDAVFHQFQISLKGQLTSVNAAGSSANTFYQGFPFSLIDQVRLIRNGSDTVWQGSGKMMAKECFFLNGAAPHARICAGSASGYLGTGNVYTASVSGITVLPANSEGIAENSAKFVDAGTASTTIYTDFECLLELWLQLGGADEKWWTTLLDARPLSSFVFEITWARVADVILAGTNATLSISATADILSYDQDGVKEGQDFGTYKRSMQQISNATYGSTGVQYLLSRGNLFQGILFETLAFKAASSSILEPENGVIASFQNRINTNYYLRDTAFQDLQRKAKNDNEITYPYGTGTGSPRGFAYLNLLGVGNRASELVQTYTMDQYDLSLNLNALAAAQNGTTTAATQPQINILTQEVIPGKGVAPNLPQGAQNGSVARTNAQPYRAI